MKNDFKKTTKKGHENFCRKRFCNNNNNINKFANKKYEKDSLFWKQFVDLMKDTEIERERK